MTPSSNSLIKYAAARDGKLSLPSDSSSDSSNSVLGVEERKTLKLIDIEKRSFKRRLSLDIPDAAR
jgi:hypothetical protein